VAPPIPAAISAMVVLARKRRRDVLPFIVVFS